MSFDCTNPEQSSHNYESHIYNNFKLPMLTGRPDRNAVISKDDVCDLKIILNTCTSSIDVINNI